jgi:hypothetical protein
MATIAVDLQAEWEERAKAAFGSAAMAWMDGEKFLISTGTGVGGGLNDVFSAESFEYALDLAQDAYTIWTTCEGCEKQLDLPGTGWHPACLYAVRCFHCRWFLVDNPDEQTKVCACTGTHEVLRRGYYQRAAEAMTGGAK